MSEHEIMTWKSDTGWGAQCRTCDARFESTDKDVISTQITQHQGDE